MKTERMGLYYSAIVFFILAIGYWDSCLWAGAIKPKVPELYPVLSMIWVFCLGPLVMIWVNIRDIQKKAADRKRDEEADAVYTKSLSR